MNVSGLAYINIRPKNINGNLNREVKFSTIPCLISSTLKDEMYLSWRDLQRIGSISPYFPEVWTNEELCSKYRATMNTKEGARTVRILPEIDDIFEEFADVFAEDLAGGKNIMKPMDIELNEEVAKHMRGRYGTDARCPYQMYGEIRGRPHEGVGGNRHCCQVRWTC